MGTTTEILLILLYNHSYSYYTTTPTIFRACTPSSEVASGFTAKAPVGTTTDSIPPWESRTDQSLRCSTLNLYAPISRKSLRVGVVWAWGRRNMRLGKSSARGLREFELFYTIIRLYYSTVLLHYATMLLLYRLDYCLYQWRIEACESLLVRPSSE